MEETSAKSGPLLFPIWEREKQTPGESEDRFSVLSVKNSPELFSPSLMPDTLTPFHFPPRESYEIVKE